MRRAQIRIHSWMVLALALISACATPTSQTPSSAVPRATLGSVPTTVATAVAVLPTAQFATSVRTTATATIPAPTAIIPAPTATIEALLPTVTPTPCVPTPPSGSSASFVPDAPIRVSVGHGHVLRGTITASADCAPVAGARIEFWLVGPNAEYDAAHRATLVTDARGAYRFESNFPPPYPGRPPHIHIRVSAPGFRTLVTQFYPTNGTTAGVFAIVLRRRPTT